MYIFNNSESLTKALFFFRVFNKALYEGYNANIGGNMFGFVKNFVDEHKDEIVKIAPYAALVVGAVALYWSSFDYGYNCRKALEKQAGEDIFNTIENLN